MARRTLKWMTLFVAAVVFLSAGSLLAGTPEKTQPVKGKTVKLCGMIKGAGMIRSDMATMLSFLVTEEQKHKELIEELIKILPQGLNQSLTQLSDLNQQIKLEIESSP